MTIITNLEDLEFKNEYDSLLNVYHKGEPFSGILKKENEEIEYKSGNAIHVIHYFANGQKSSEEYLKHGTLLEKYSWFENGTLKSQFKYDYDFYNESGTVLTIGYSLYSNGKLESKSENGISKSFTKNGELVVESKWTPGEKYRKEYYLNGVLKYLHLPTIKKSFHFTKDYLIIIDEDKNYGRSNIFYDKIRIKTNICELFFSEGNEYGFSDHADKIRVNRLTTWLVNTVQSEDTVEYARLNFNLCFCKDKSQADNAFHRIVKKFDDQEVIDYMTLDIPNVEKSEAQKMIEKLRIEISKK